MKICYQIIAIQICYLLIAGCSSPVQKLDPSVFYKRDMKLKVNGQEGVGAVISRRAGQYEIEIDSFGEIDILMLHTCHREVEKKERKFIYRPMPIEQTDVSCPLMLSAYDKKKGQHSWGLIEFEHPKLSLPAKSHCNGRVEVTKGVSVCQSFAGSIQEIHFKKAVLAPEKDVCLVLKSVDSRVFRYKMPKGLCTFRFLTQSGDEQWHRLTTIGHEKMILRGK